MALIVEKRPDLKYFNPNDVIIEWDQRLGEGGFCTAYRAVWRGTYRRCCRTHLSLSLPVSKKRIEIESPL
jgi:hypothetical protein|tara:strand:- start:19369 stop:19578 length:210 start_codon:yes stop_codon:yes gene_type:complete